MISDLREDIKIVGVKAANLAKLLKMGLKVPKSLVLTTKAYDIFLEYNNIKSIDELRDKDIASLKVPPEILEEINKKTKDFRRPLIFRSSSTIEDTKGTAGIFKSVLNIYNDVDVENAIKECYLSLAKASKIIEQKKLEKDELKMAILIQEQVVYGKFGVAVGDENRMMVEVCLNDPKGITSGRAKVRDIYTIVGDDYYKFSRRDWYILFDFEIEKLGKIRKKLSDVFSPYDIEFVFTRGDLYLLQIRQFFGELPEIRNPNVYGIGVSHGRVRGKVSFFPEDPGEDRIAVAEEICLDDIEDVLKYGGIIVETLSLLSHVAMHARELGIPAIIGIPTRYFRKGEEIEIDGKTGEVIFLERKGFKMPEIKKEITIIDPLKLETILIGKYLILVYPCDDFFIAYYRDYRGLEDLLKIIEVPVVDGGVDRWHTYSVILEMAKIDIDVRKDFLRVVRSLKCKDINKIKEVYRDVKNKFLSYYYEAKRRFSIYLAEKAYAYLRMIDVILFDYGQILRDAKDFIEFVKDTEKETLPEMEEIYDLFSNLCANFRDRMGIDRSEYTSRLAFFNEIIKRGGDLW